MGRHLHAPFSVFPLSVDQPSCFLSPMGIRRMPTGFSCFLFSATIESSIREPRKRHRERLIFLFPETMIFLYPRIERTTFMMYNVRRIFAVERLRVFACLLFQYSCWRIQHEYRNGGFVIIELHACYLPPRRALRRICMKSRSFLQPVSNLCNARSIVSIFCCTFNK